MQSVIELIEHYSKEHSDFRYYLDIATEAEQNEEEHPDIAIECCASLLQGISKSIVHRLDTGCDRAAFENLSLQKQVRAALECLRENSDIVEDEFARNCETLVRGIGSLRNARGDISHGRAVPKELQSHKSLSRLIMSVTEAMLRYMLGNFFAIQPVTPQIPYEDNVPFNDYLDRENPLPGKALYSLALYQQYYEDYLIRLQDFIESDDGGADVGNAN